MFHLGQDYRLHESNVSRIIQKVEDILIKSGKFSLPSKRRLFKEDGLTYTIVDVTEIAIERPKKTETRLFGEKGAAQFRVSVDYLRRKSRSDCDLFRQRQS